MQLTLQGLVPRPLRERVTTGRSDVWHTTAQFTKPEWLFIQAPSGTGKTTLIHILYGLRNDYDGSLQWGDVPMHNLYAEQLAKLRAGSLSVIFQDMRLFPELTAWENIEIKRRLANNVTEQQAGEWLTRLGMQHKRDAIAATLSYGEQQRIAIIRALVQPFDWLLMDEPFSHLDHANRTRAAALIAEVVLQQKAGLLLADLDDNDYFAYTKKLQL